MGSGGWVELHGGDLGLPGRTYVRFTLVGERYRITELYVDGRGEPIQPGSLRRFALGVVEDWLSREDWLAFTADKVSVDLSRLATHYQTMIPQGGRGSAGYAGRTCSCCGGPVRGDELWRKRHAEVAARQGRDFAEQPLTDWIELSLLAQLGPAYEHKGLPPIPQATEAPKPQRVDAEPEPIMLADPQFGLTDAFLQDVARAYRAAVGQGHTNPAVVISELPTVNVGVRTVHSWIYKARRRGFLPPARKDRRPGDGQH